MTQVSESPITLERFNTGKTFQQYLDSGIANRELFERNYNGLTISPEQAKRLKALSAKGVARIAVIGEDWCPDVYRGLGVAQRIAEAAGIELRFFERDQNKELIQPYRKNGEFESIPVYVFFDKDHHYLAHFIERPKVADSEMHLVRAAMGDTSPAGIAKKLGHEPSEEEVAAERAASRVRYMEWQQGDVWAGWRVAAVDEVIELLEAATK
ncbi:MAG TPA: thioredoxin family protein [Tepidiformaceae bacterium]